jgi:hypothetical protein
LAFGLHEQERLTLGRESSPEQFLMQSL